MPQHAAAHCQNGGGLQVLAQRDHELTAHLGHQANGRVQRWERLRVPISRDGGLRHHAAGILSVLCPRALRATEGMRDPGSVKNHAGVAGPVIRRFSTWGKPPAL